MKFRFLALNDEAAFDNLGEFDVAGDFSQVKLAVEGRFEGVIGTLKVRQIIVLSGDVGDRPGRIVAAEAVYMAHMNGKVKESEQARSLIWLIEDYVPKH
jgi:hypothetical protein